MRKIILIPCCKSKCKKSKTKPVFAKDLYTGAGFKKCLKYARTLTSDENIFILSAKHHLLRLEDEVKWYDKCLKNVNAEEKRQWAAIVNRKLQQVSDLKKDKYIILAGKDYYLNLLDERVNEHISCYEIPMEGLRQGPRLHWLDEHTKGDKL